MKFIKTNRNLLGLTLLFLFALLLENTRYIPLLDLVVMSLLTLLAGFNIFKKAIMDLRYKIIGIDLLVTLAVIGAFIIGDYFEAAAVTYLFTLGHELEKKSIEKTHSALHKLFDLKPSIARVIQGDKEQMVELELVQVGDELLVKPGEKIPTDGTIIEGNVTIDEQMMSGESLPVEKQPGDFVYGATIVKAGYLKMKATAIIENTALSQMIRMVEEAQDKKATTQKFIERFSRYYTPLVALLAVVVFLATLEIRLAITMLVIACPGALVIATPVSFVAGIGNGAKKGILFKGGDGLEKLTKTPIILFDKTGTLTQGKPEIKKIISYHLPMEEMLKIAAAGEAHSEHPLAQAILHKSASLSLIKSEEATAIEMMVGKGVSFTYNEKRYYIGNQKMLPIPLDEKSLNDIREFEEKGMTTLIMSDEFCVLGIFALADTLRKEAKQLIFDLRKMGIKKMIMLTGDQPKVAATIAQELQLDGYEASLLPQDKANYIQAYQQSNPTIFVGDGINDALAMSYASVSIAVGGLGKDLAMETADVVLMSDQLGKLKETLLIAHQVKKTMIQNIGLALLVVLFLILGVLFKQVSMSLGMLVHELSVLIVLLNAIRLLKYRPEERYEKTKKHQ